MLEIVNRHLITTPSKFFKRSPGVDRHAVRDPVAARPSALFMQRQGYYVDPHDLDMAYYRLEVATERRDDAVTAVEEATGVSVITLVGAAFACGAAAAAPTP